MEQGTDNEDGDRDGEKEEKDRGDDLGERVRADMIKHVQILMRERIHEFLTVLKTVHL